MSYIEKSLGDNEKILAIFKLHWINYVLLVIWILLTIASTVWVFSAGNVVFILVGLFALLSVYEYLRLINIEHGLTNYRLIYKKGFISRHTAEIRVGAIETTPLKQGILGRILNYGTIEITGKGNSRICFINITNPMDAKRLIAEQRDHTKA